jgi:cephalosporin-C deacetylase-like acetyl esterase
MQLFTKLQEEYDQLWKYIIRPARTPYPETALGPETFSLEGITIKRCDFQLTNEKGYVFYCSHFVPLHLEQYPCVIYMHGNSSNRT